jgi:hypothetical protein
MRHPYSVLLPVGFAVPPLLPAARCAFTAPFRPYRAEATAVYFLWHCPLGHPSRELPGTVPRWSPDFPPLPGYPNSGGRPTLWQCHPSRRPLVLARGGRAALTGTRHQ